MCFTSTKEGIRFDPRPSRVTPVGAKAALPHHDDHNVAREENIRSRHRRLGGTNDPRPGETPGPPASAKTSIQPIQATS